MSRFPRTDWDGLVLVLLPLATMIVALLTRPNYLLGVLLFHGLPAAYLVHSRSTLFSWVVVLSAIVVSLPFAIIVDYIGVMSSLWFVPRTVFAVRLLDAVPFEDLVWLGTAVFTLFVLYYRFNELPAPRDVSSRLGIYAAVSLAAVTLFAMSARARPSLYAHDSPYTYLVVATLFFLAPALLLLLRRPTMMRAAAPVALYFLYLTVTFELVATHLGYWTFPGSYAFAALRLLTFGPVPLEELVFVGIVGPYSALAVLTWLYPIALPPPGVSSR